VVSSGDVTNMAVTPFRHSEKPHATRKLHGSVFYRTVVTANGSLRTGGIPKRLVCSRQCAIQIHVYLTLPTLHCERNFRLSLLLWLWPWPDDLYIWIWPVFPGDILDVQIWTSYM